MNAKLKYGLVAILIGFFLMVFLFFWSAQKEVNLSGNLTYNSAKAESFFVENKRIIINPDAGITRDLLISYADKNVEIIGKITTITEGVSGPDCYKVQIGCEREVEVVLPEKIKIMG
tara:strand:+ start:7986 stop:8336 length:351 start_codon:yes stop_codon:yes gene_type:complete